MADSEWNRALRTLQRVAQQRIDSLPTVEIGYQNFVPHSEVQGLRSAISMAASLIEPEEKS